LQAKVLKDTYRKRAGVEGTFAQVTRNTGLRRSRYIGLGKTHLQHLFAAIATNIVRLVNWLNGTPFARTRISRFASLAA
jgi:transposase